MSSVVEVMRNELYTALLLCEPSMCLWTALNNLRTKIILELETGAVAIKARGPLIDRLGTVTRARDMQWERVAPLYSEVQKAKCALEAVEKMERQIGGGGAGGNSGAVGPKGVARTE